MKKITALFFLFFLCLLYRKENLVEPVSSETYYLSEPSYCLVTFPNQDLNTKNFEEYLKGVTVLSMKPYINEIYKNKMHNVEMYTFTPNTHIHNLRQFTSLYKESLRNNGILNEVAKIDLYGIPIEEVKVLCQDSHLSYLNGLSYQIKIRNK